MKKPNLREQFESKLPKRAVESLKTNKEEYYRLYSKWLETINSEMIDALVEAKEAIESWIESTDCGCDEYHICGLPKRQQQLEQIEQALKKAGCGE